jgi:hypothetical protein
LQASLDDYLSPEKAGMFETDGVFKQFHLDVIRSKSTTINGQVFTSGGVRADGKPGTADDLFRSVVKPEHRKAISSFLNQQVQSTAAFLLSKAPLPAMATLKDGMDLSGTRGLHMLAAFSLDGGGTSASSLLYFTYQAYKLAVAPDGKSARLVVDSTATVTPRIAGVDSKCFNYVAGTITCTQDITFDLTKNPPTVASVHIGQTIEA